jgi:hypothetical protein
MINSSRIRQSSNTGGMAVTNLNYLHEENKSTLNFGKGSYHSDKNPYSI